MKYTALLLAVACLAGILLLSEVTAGSNKWEKVKKSTTEETLRAVYFGDEKNVFAVGDKGTILTSKDAGKKWKKLSSDSKATLRGVHFIDAKRGWICGDGDPDGPHPKGHKVTGRPMKCGTCLITSDGGKKWENVWVQTNFDLRSIWMASKKIGQICNHGGEDHADGDKVITKDGGKTWEQRRVYRGLNDCCWVSEKEGWAVGEGGVILKTTDGGKKWKKEKSPVKETFYGLHFDKKGKTGIAVGEKGTIIRLGS